MSDKNRINIEGEYLPRSFTMRGAPGSMTEKHPILHPHPLKSTVDINREKKTQGIETPETPQPT